MRKINQLAAVLSACVPFSAAAQDAGTVFTFGLTSELRASDNWTLVDPSPGNSHRFDNALTFGLVTATRRSKVEVDLGARLHATSIAGGPEIAGIADPFARASFERSGPDSMFTISAGAAVTDRDIDFTDAVGDQLTADVALGYSFGSSAPLGGAFSFTHSAQFFEDGLDDDEDTSLVTGRIDIRPSSKVTFSPLASMQRHEVKDGGPSVTETTRVGLEVEAVVSDALTFNGSASAVTIEGPSTTSETTTFSGSLTADAQNGTHRLAASTDLSTSGERKSLSYTRTLDIGDSEARLGIGVAEASDGETVLTADIAFERTFARGTLSTALTRGYSTAPDGTETLETGLQAAFRQELGQLASLRLAGSYQATAETGSEEDASADASISFNRSVAQDWDLSVGYEHRWEQDAGEDPIRSNTVFLRLARTWVSQR